MSARLRWAALGLCAALAQACVVAGVDDGYGPGYYEPEGAVYGGWGVDYAVGPFRGGDRDRDHRAEAHDDRGGQHAYRPAAASRGIPSIPTGARSGGGARGGGGHGGGGGGHH
jgi:hypothetical protein